MVSQYGIGVFPFKIKGLASKKAEDLHFNPLPLTRLWPLIMDFWQSSIFGGSLFSPLPQIFPNCLLNFLTFFDEMV